MTTHSDATDKDKLLHSWNIQLSLWEDDVRDIKVKELKRTKKKEKSLVSFHRSQTLLMTKEKYEE